MMLKDKVKRYAVDYYLLPVRKQIVELVQPNSTVLDFGCGSGDLLFKLSHKIKEGIGFDNSKSFIHYANKRKSLYGITNIFFNHKDLCKRPIIGRAVNYSIASLFFHTIPKNDVDFLLKQMIEVSDVIIVCGFSKPENWKQSFLLFLDQRFSSHYSCFKMYKNNNYMEGILTTIRNINIECISTFDPVIRIYKIIKLQP